MYLVWCVFGVVCVWCVVCLVWCVFSVVCIWCDVYLVWRVFSVVCVWCGVSGKVKTQTLGSEDEEEVFLACCSVGDFE